jgi:2-polyprenyl-3-methyl-5-hydroxy-6-metoxy-1,4-benzoquinol methylase
VIPTPEQVRQDFDRIADLPGWGLDHSRLYHDFLLARMPRPCGDALDVGCGTGAFAREMAARARRVTGIDLSPRMIALASERSRAFPDIEYREADVVAMDLGEARYDFIASIAMLHHVEAEPLLERMAAALRPGGVLAVLDVRSVHTAWDWVAGGTAIAVSTALRFARTGRPRGTAETRAAWRDHGSRERYLDMGEARALAARVLPGSEVRRHAFLRYSLVWTRPSVHG